MKTLIGMGLGAFILGAGGRNNSHIPPQDHFYNPLSTLRAARSNIVAIVTSVLYRLLFLCRHSEKFARISHGIYYG